jgi:hypothetical protein
MNVPGGEGQMNKEEMGFQQGRRRVLLAGASAICLASCATTQPEPLPPIEIKGENVKDVPGLIAAMKQGAGNRLPATTSDESFFQVFARVFVEHAVEAAEKYHIPVPQWVLDQLPSRKVVLPIIPIAAGAGLLVFEWLGATWVIPLAVVFVAVLGSLVLMTGFIAAAIGIYNDSHKATNKKT